MQHWVLEYYQICSNDDPGLTLPILWQGQIWSLMVLNGKKEKQLIFQKLLLFMITKMVDAIKQMSTWSFIAFKGQGHSMTFVKGHSDSTFSNFYSLETPKPIEAKFHVKPEWD